MNKKEIVEKLELLKKEAKEKRSKAFKEGNLCGNSYWTGREKIIEEILELLKGS